MNHKVLIIEEARKKENLQDKLQSSIIAPSVLKCQTHGGTKIKFACSTCNVLVCIECTVIKHRGHKFEELTKHATQQKQKITEGMGFLLQAENKLGESIKEAKAEIEKIEEKRKEVEGKIEEECQRLEAALKARKRELLAKSEEISTTKLTGLSIQIDELSSLKDQITSCNSIVTTIANFSDTEVLAIITPLLAQLSRLSKRFMKRTLEPTESDTLTVEMDSNKVQGAIAAFGAVLETPNQTPRDYTSLTTPTLTIAAGNPYDIAVCNNGDIIVAYYGSHSVQIFDATGKLKSTFGTYGTGNGRFQSPLGVCECEGIVFVGEFSGGRIQKMTKKGQFLSMFGSRGSLNGKLSYPWGCAINKLNGKVYIADAGNNRVQVFNPDGTFSRIIGGGGSTPQPRAVALDPDGNVHVATYGASVMNVFSMDGHFIREYGNGILSTPSGVAIDKYGYCIVGDWNNHAVYVFDPHGKHIHKISFSSSICGTEVDNEGCVYVVENGNKKIHKF